MTAEDFNKKLEEYVKEKMERATKNLYMGAQDRLHFTLLFQLQYYRDFVSTMFFPELKKVEIIQ